ncbi:MAG: hypothetical protein R3343_06435, partial [Nitriliruptorales bacterium]|nr:hypothetical protein [Nitriliruptorales bacterium]
MERGEATGGPSHRGLVAALVWTLFVSLAVGLQAWLADPADAQAEQRGAAEEQPLVDGELLWKRDCASCHGA